MNKEIFEKRIGIIGAGNIGRALILKLLEKGIPGDNIKLSYNGSIFTFEKLYDNNMVDMISDNSRIVKESDIIILTLPPQAFKQIGDFGLTEDKTIISFMSAIKIEDLKKQTGSNDITRVIPTGPDTITKSTSLAGMYPDNITTKELLDIIDTDYYVVENEDQMDLMVLAGCLPAVYCKCDPNNPENIKAIEKIAGDCTSFIEYSKKATKLVPKENKEEFIDKFSTPGGITEAIITSLDEGKTLYEALKNGLKRNKELS